MELIDVLEKPKCNEEAFLESGECSDEIIFEFENDQKLYVSQNLLTMASPVFKAMFDSKSNFKENKDRTVKMVGKGFKDVREFLLCLHPDIKNDVHNDNALSIAPIAEEYQSRRIVEECKEILNKYLYSLHAEPTGTDMYKTAHKCLLILNTAVVLNYEPLVDKSIEAIARFGFRYFTGEEDKSPYHRWNTASRNDCRDTFNKISPDIKIRIFIARLNKCDNHDYV